MFTARTGPEVQAPDEDVGAGVLLLVEHEVSVVAPLREEPLLETGALDTLEPVGRDDLIGVDVGAVERDGGALDDADGFHCGAPGMVRSLSCCCAQAKSSGDAKCPAMAVAAAMAGETRWVRPPRP